MAYSRSSRRADAKLEAGVKLVLFAILGLALAVGGLTHFGDALKGILLLIVMIAVVGGAALLISKSRLMASKKLGLALAFGAVVMTLLWAALRIPSQWVEDRATVTAIKSGTATLRLGATVFSPTASVAVPQGARWQVGSSVPVWIDPVSKAQLAFAPRATEGGQHYGKLWVAGVFLVGALWLLCGGGPWIAPEAPASTAPGDALPPRGFQAPFAAPRPVAPPSTASRLRLIDWFQFEAVCARILEAEGWTVERRGGANADGGADHLAFKDGRKMVVQCKHWETLAGEAGHHSRPDGHEDQRGIQGRRCRALHAQRLYRCGP